MVLPATNAGSECSFSAMRCVTSYLWSTMSQGQLNHLTMLSVHKDLTDKQNLSSICSKQFCFWWWNCVLTFGQFWCFCGVFMWYGPSVPRLSCMIMICSWHDRPKYTSHEPQAGTHSLGKQLPQAWLDHPKLVLVPPHCRQYIPRMYTHT